MAAVLRLESADIDDPYTLVDLEHVKTLDSSNPVNTSTSCTYCGLQALCRIQELTDIQRATDEDFNS